MNKKHTNAFAYINQDEYLNVSSSGGAFLGIAKVFFSINKDGRCSAYGACFDENLNVRHERVLTFEGTKRFCGSKYVQSDCLEAYKKAKKDLLEGYNVLFTGTPCQISVLKNTLKSSEVNVEKLLTVDIVCHGTPKAEIWKEYKSYIEQKEGSKLKFFSFRYKPAGWKGYPTFAEFENGKKYINSYKISHFITLFRKDLLIQQGCFNCIFPGHYQSDITIADFWGIEFCLPEIDTKKGVSIMIFHNEQCEEIKKCLSNYAKVMIEMDDDSYLIYNHNLLNKTLKPKEYDDFWQDYKQQGIGFVICKYAGNSLKEKIKFEVIRMLRYTGLLYTVKRMMHKA